MVGTIVFSAKSCVARFLPRVTIRACFKNYGGPRISKRPEFQSRLETSIQFSGCNLNRRNRDHHAGQEGIPHPKPRVRVSVAALGLFDATMLVAGTMIGSAHFHRLELTSPPRCRLQRLAYALLVWALTGVMTIIGGLSYAELAAMMPRAGGQYVYLREA